MNSNQIRLRKVGLPNVGTDSTECVIVLHNGLHIFMKHVYDATFQVLGPSTWKRTLDVVETQNGNGLHKLF